MCTRCKRDSSAVRAECLWESRTLSENQVTLENQAYTLRIRHTPLENHALTLWESGNPGESGIHFGNQALTLWESGTHSENHALTLWESRSRCLRIMHPLTLSVSRSYYSLGIRHSENHALTLWESRSLILRITHSLMITLSLQFFPYFICRRWVSHQWCRHQKKKKKNLRTSKTHFSSVLSPRSFPNISFQVVPVFIWLTVTISRPFRVRRWLLTFPRPPSTGRSMVWSPWLEVHRQCLERLTSGVNRR